MDMQWTCGGHAVDMHAPARLEDAQCLAECGGLVRSEAEGSVGDDGIHGCGGEGQLLEVALLIQGWG